MTCARGLAFFLLAAIPAAAVAQEKTIDPATLKDKVTIKLGQKRNVRFEQEGHALVRPKVVDEVAKKPPTPSFDFQKMGDNLILITQNPFTKDLKFRAAMRLKGSKDYVETSIVPVIGGLFGAELWQDPIEELVLFDFKLVNKQ